MKDDVFGAVSFLTIFGRGRPPTESSKYWFFVAGIIVALVTAGAWKLLGGFPAHIVVGAVVVLVIVISTGAIHFDGLADASDGLLAHLDTSKRFEVMSGPEVGTFGIVSVVLALLLLTASISFLRPNVLLLIGVMTLSREMSAFVMESVPYAKSDGIVSIFGANSGLMVKPKLILAGEILASTSALMLALGLKGLIISVLMGLVQLVVVMRARSLIGGYSGDVLGASIVATETIALVFGALMQR